MSRKPVPHFSDKLQIVNRYMIGRCLLSDLVIGPSNPASERSMVNRFLLRTPEKEDFNQYWYSAPSIEAMVEDVCQHAGEGGAAMMSTPSVYYSLPDEVRKNCKVLDIDSDKFQKDPGFVYYDFNDPMALPEELHHKFSMVVIDPPFITREVWEKYTTAAKLLLREGTDETGAPLGKILLSTIVENADMMKELLGVCPQKFQPSIPNLVYQYNFYTNYESEVMNQRNPEIPE